MQEPTNMWHCACARTDLQAGTCIYAVPRAAARHLDVINQCEWTAVVWLGLELQRKGPFWGWTDANSLWQGSY